MDSYPTIPGPLKPSGPIFSQLKTLKVMDIYHLGTMSIFNLPRLTANCRYWVGGNLNIFWKNPKSNHDHTHHKDHDHTPQTSWSHTTNIMITHHKHHDHIPQIYNITFNCNTQQSRQLTTWLILFLTNC